MLTSSLSFVRCDFPLRATPGQFSLHVRDHELEVIPFVTHVELCVLDWRAHTIGLEEVAIEHQDNMAKRPTSGY